MLYHNFDTLPELVLCAANACSIADTAVIKPTLAKVTPIGQIRLFSVQVGDATFTQARTLHSVSFCSHSSTIHSTGAFARSMIGTSTTNVTALSI